MSGRTSHPRPKDYGRLGIADEKSETMENLLLQMPDALRMFFAAVGVFMLFAAALAAIRLFAFFISVCNAKRKAAYAGVMRKQDTILGMERGQSETGQELFAGFPQAAALYESRPYASTAEDNFAVVDDLIKDYGVAKPPVGADSKAAAIKTLNERDIVDEFIADALAPKGRRGG